MRIIALVPVLCAGVLAGCGAPPPADPFATGGSRSGGLVEMAVRREPGQQINMAKADDDATRRCLSWGYVGALRYPGTRTECVDSGMFGGCTLEEVHINYECTGVGAQVVD